MKKILCSFLTSLTLIAQAQFVIQDYTNCNNGFLLNGNTYNLLSCAYVVQPTQDCSGGYYLSPSWNYSTIWGYDCNSPTAGRGTYGSASNCRIQMNSDLADIASLGFTTIRLNGLHPFYNSATPPVLTPFSSSFSNDYTMIDTMLSRCAAHNLKVILCVQTGTAQAESNVDDYANYLAGLAAHLKNNTTLLSYDICNESFNGFHITNQYDKYKIAGWVNYWYYTIKKNDPNHLVDIGLMEPVFSAGTWEPEIMNVDFIGHHLYAYEDGANLAKTEDKMKFYLSWLKDNTKRPYIIGETGYSATNTGTHPTGMALVGNETDQNQYAFFMLQQTLDCGCKGLVWWQYKDIMWGDASDWSQNYYGLKTYYNANAK